MPWKSYVSRYFSGGSGDLGGRHVEGRSLGPRSDLLRRDLGMEIETARGLWLKPRTEEREAPILRLHIEWIVTLCQMSGGASD